MLSEGLILNERYEIISKVGTGGMADVYKARDLKLNRLVALKVLKPEFREDKTFVSKFRKEAQAAAGLAHPNVVNVYDVGEDGDISFIVMELVEGITLKNYIRKKGKLSVKEATSIAIQVSLGLEAAHKRDIIHRDVKPQNIIISTDGKVKLSDFGIARVVSSNTITSNVMVSVHYSSPEQVRGGYSDKKSDIYSLGITMYEMVTGRLPFDGDTSVAVAIKHLQEEMVPPTRYTPDLPFSFEQIILKCTQKSVERRYDNLSEVIDDLKHSLVDPQGDFVVLPPLSSYAQTVKLTDEELAGVRQRPASGLPSEGEILESAEDVEDDFDDDDDGIITSKLEKAMTIGGFIIGAVIIGILIYFIGTAAGVFRLGSGSAKVTPTPTATETPTPEEMVEVPDLLGMTVEEAKKALSQTGLGLVKGGEQTSDKYKKGQIMEQSVEAGAKVEVHTTIQYTLSTGSAQLTVPNVVNQSQDNAVAALENMGLKADIKQEFSSDVEAGYVMSVSPNVGEKVDAGATVTLTVSKGASAAEVTVTEVRGLTEEQATRILENSGLVVTTVAGQSDSYNQGDVISQSIEAGAKVSSGTTIELTINKPASEDPALDPQNGEDSSGNNTSGSWKTSTSIQEPYSYNGGPVRLVLTQGSSSTTLVDGAQISFPYQVNAAGIDGMDSGTVTLYELVDGDYKERETYSVTFSQS